MQTDRLTGQRNIYRYDSHPAGLFNTPYTEISRHQHFKCPVPYSHKIINI